MAPAPSSGTVAAPADIVVAAVGADALVVEPPAAKLADELVDATVELLVEAVVKLVVELMDKLVDATVELVVVAVVKLMVALAAGAALKLVVVEGGSVVRELGSGTEEVGDAVWTAAAAYVAGSLESSSSKKRSIRSLGHSHFAMGQFS